MTIEAGIKAGLAFGPLSEVATTVYAANGWKDVARGQTVKGAAKILAAGAAMGVYRKMLIGDILPLSRYLSFCMPMIATAGLVFAVSSHLFNRFFTPSKQPNGAQSRGSIRTAPSTRT